MSHASLADRADPEAKRFAQMREAFDDALVSDWQEPEGGLSLPDQDDRHVLAAAIRGGAQAIITANAKDFPAAALAPGRLGQAQRSPARSRHPRRAASIAQCAIARVRQRTP
jgi:PIN domain